MTGKISFLGALALCIVPLCASAADPADTMVEAVPSPWTISLSKDVRWFDWRSTLGNPAVTLLGARGRGTQIYTPVTLSISGPLSQDLKLDFVARGGYVYSSQRTYGQKGNVSTLTDTQLNATLTYSGWNGFQPFASLLVNLPTGRSALRGNARFARVDSDLVDMGSFGEGWNVGPTLGVNIALSQAWMATISAGYTYRGPYDKEGFDPISGFIIGTDRVKNGSEATVTTSLAYNEGPLNFNISTSYAFNTASVVNNPGQFNYQRYKGGDRFMVSASAGYNWNDNWNSSASFNFVHSQKNKILAGGALVTEPFNSNSNLYRIDLTPATYQSAAGWSLGPTLSYTYRDRNRYDPFGFGFSPAKQRYAIGLTGGYKLSNSVSLNGKIEYVRIRESANIGPPLLAPIVPIINGRAIAGTFGATVNF